MEQITEGPIHKDMTIGEATQTYPQIIETLSGFGVHCVGCGASYVETLEQGLKGHGAMSDEEFDEALKQLNEVAVKGMPKEEPSSDKPLVFTDNALTKLKEMQEKQGKSDHGLRIEVIPGGCSGMSYSFEFVKEPTGEDITIDLGGVNMYVDPQSLDMLKGSTVEFVETFQNAGFKIKNPNSTGSCGCGQSFS